jgi:hypothetical protein
MYGYFTHGTDPPPRPCLSGFLSLPNHLRRLPSQAHFRRRFPGHATFTALKVLHSRIRYLDTVRGFQILNARLDRRLVREQIPVRAFPDGGLALGEQQAAHISVSRKATFPPNEFCSSLFEPTIRSTGF